MDGRTDSVDLNLGKLQEIGSGRPAVLESMGSQRVRHDLAAEQQEKIQRVLRS